MAPTPSSSINPAVSLRSLLIAVTLGIAPVSALADSLGELRALVDASDNATAWDMARRMEPENGGDPEFDFLYGLIAKNLGNRNEAVFAFERALLVQPDNPRLKLELADTYFQFGNRDEARPLFEQVLASAPPEPVQQRIRTYLGAMEAQDKQSGLRFGGHLGLAGGYDSNLNSATDDNDFTINFLGIPVQVPLDPTARAIDGGFIEARAGLDLVAPANQRTIRFLSFAVQRRANDEFMTPDDFSPFQAGNFSFTQTSLTGGYLLKRGSATWRIPLAVSSLSAESERAVNSTPRPINDDRFQGTLGLEYSRPLSAHSSFTAFTRAGESHFPSEPDRNAWLLTLGGAYSWSASSSPLTINVSAYVGTEPAQEDTLNAERNGKDYGSLRLGFRYGLGDTQALTIALGTQVTSYHEAPAISTWGERVDGLVDAAIGWQWQATKSWQVAADVSMAKNDSADNTLYDFERTQGKLGATWRF